ncbi:MAG TPA: hypothetical protein VF791_14285 [Pyrinomonadaceae bacterium]
MSILSAKEFSGPQGSDYVGFWAGNIAEPYGGVDEPLMRRAFRLIEKHEPRVLPNSGASPTYVLGVDIPEGAQFLSYAAWDDVKNAFPKGVEIKVIKPDGQPLVLDGEDLTGEDVIWETAPNGSLALFSFVTPLPGTWTFQVSVSENVDQFQIFTSTLPLTNDLNTIEEVMAEAFPELTRPEVLEELGEGLAPGGWGCTWCKIGVWVVAVLIVAAIIAGVVAITGPNSVIIAGLVRITKLASQTVLAWFRMTFGGIGTMSVGMVAANICTWTGACKKLELI